MVQPRQSSEFKPEIKRLSNLNQCSLSAVSLQIFEGSFLEEFARQNGMV